MLFSYRKKRLQEFRDCWAKPIERYRNFNFIDLYHRLLNHSGSEHTVDEKTWSDLDFSALFTKMDRATTGIGQQYLYHLLHTYEPDESILKKRYETILALKNNQNFREQIQLKFLELSSSSSHFIALLILDQSLPGTKYYRLLYLFPLLFLLSLLGITVSHVCILTTMAIAIINLILNQIFSKTIYRYFSGFSALNALIHTALSIGNIKEAHTVAEIENLQQQRILLKSLKKNLGYLVIDKEALNEMVRVGIEYLNMFFLFDVIAYYRSVKTLRLYQSEIHSVYKNVASLDASIAVASYLEEMNHYSTPVFHTKSELTMHQLFHPLIEHAVPNSVENFSSSMLITGSNMSGKTSFMKTVGLNMILAQTLYFVHANGLTMPRRFVKTSIKRNEDLEAGKSYFFAEIEELQNFLQLSDEANTYVFFIDEIFRGTNTLERLAASTAVLKNLSSCNTVFVTTHDIELQELLDGHFQMYHFSEQVEGDRFFFNYKINKGSCTSGNAIKLLELMKYPDSIVQEANALAKDLLSDSLL